MSHCVMWHRYEAVILSCKTKSKDYFYSLAFFYFEESIKAGWWGNVMLHVAGQDVKLDFGFGMWPVLSLTSLAYTFILFSNPHTGKRIFSSPNHPDLLCAHPASHLMCIEGSFLRVSLLECQVNHSLHLVQRLTMNAAISTLPLYAIMEQAG